MKPTQVALYARVSSDQQSEAKTIESQVADPRTRIAATERHFLLSWHSSITATVEQPSSVLPWNGCAMWLPPVGLINFMCIVLLGWRATMLTKSSWSARQAAWSTSRNGSVLGGAPYGYRYVTQQEGAGEASFEIVWEEAHVVRQGHHPESCVMTRSADEGSRCSRKAVFPEEENTPTTKQRRRSAAHTI